MLVLTWPVSWSMKPLQLNIHLRKKIKYFILKQTKKCFIESPSKQFGGYFGYFSWRNHRIYKEGKHEISCSWRLIFASLVLCLLSAPYQPHFRLVPWSRYKSTSFNWVKFRLNWVEFMMFNLNCCMIRINYANLQLRLMVLCIA